LERNLIGIFHCQKMYYELLFYFSCWYWHFFFTDRNILSLIKIKLYLTFIITIISCSFDSK
jgi:hypothetical protein